MIETAIGPKDEADLKQRIVERITLTGKSITTEYWFEGTLVRGDVHFVFNPDYVPEAPQ